MKSKGKTDGDETGREAQETGYCKPPRAYQFQPGKSGNPRGRPVGSRSRGSKAATYELMRQITLEEAYRPIEIRVAGKVVAMLAYQAAMRSLSLQSAAGKVASQRLFFRLVENVQQEIRKEQLKLFETLMDYKIAGEIELRRRRELGLSEADMIPHPDHLVIEPMTGRVVVCGPVSPAETAMVNRQKKMRALHVRKIRGYERTLERTPGDTGLLELIECCKRVIAAIDESGPGERVLIEGGEG